MDPCACARSHRPDPRGSDRADAVEVRCLWRFLVDTATHEVRQAARTRCSRWCSQPVRCGWRRRRRRLSAAAALSGRTGLECLLVAATVLTGAATVGWVGAVVDRERDRRAGRTDRPVAMGRVEPGTVTFATACAVLLLVPLSMANGTAAGLAFLAAVLSLWLYHLALARTVLSPLPWAVSFGLLPAFLSYGGLGGGLHGGPPTIAMTLLTALLGVGLHVLAVLPGLVGDNETGARHLPLRIALRIGAARLLWIATAADRGRRPRDRRHRLHRRPAPVASSRPTRLLRDPPAARQPRGPSRERSSQHRRRSRRPRRARALVVRGELRGPDRPGLQPHRRGGRPLAARSTCSTP